MTAFTKNGNTVTCHIEQQADETCELCSKKAECRPYGPKGENVCFTCGMLDEAAMIAQFTKRRDNATEVH